MIRLGRGQGCLLADTLRWIGFSEDDDGAGAPPRRQLTARPRRQPTGPRAGPLHGQRVPPKK